MSVRPRAPLRPGARVGAFVVREEIGFGATSIVYEAEHRKARRRVAVKVLRSLADLDGELRLRFEREMKLCANVVSMHVPKVYEVGKLPSGLPYIVMERLNGATLADWLAVYRRLPVPVVVEIGIQLCAALEALHERSVVHRDVKPENLVLHRAFGDGYVLKLVDFGICKPLADEGPAITRRGTVVGTPQYMSPEQVQGGDVDVRTDVYSAGVVLYELLAGRTPFEGRDLDLLGRAILFGSPPRVSALREEVSALLEGIIMRAISRDRGSRHPTVGALRRELERFADENALARHPHVWSLLPASSVARPIMPPPPPEPRLRPPHPTLATPRIPMRRAPLFAAWGALAALVTAGLGVAYYVQTPAPATPRAVRTLGEDEVEREAPPSGPAPASEDADPGVVIEPVMIDPIPIAPSAGIETREVRVGDEREATTGDADDVRPAQARSRSSSQRRGRARSSRRPEAAGPSETTVAFAPASGVAERSPSRAPAELLAHRASSVAPDAERERNASDVPLGEPEPSDPASATDAALSEPPSPHRSSRSLTPAAGASRAALPENPF